MPRVSVIIPTYNCARYLEAAIESVFAQTYGDYEIIVVDDGSTDETPQLLASYGDSIRALKQENSGHCVARNRAILESRGELIAFLDHDDLWTPNKLEVCIKAFDEHPEVGAVYSNYDFIDENGESIKPLEIELQGLQGNMPSGEVYYDFLGAFYGIPTTVVHRRECCHKAGLWDPHCDWVGDWDMWLRIARYYRFLHIPEVLAHYRLHSSAMTKDSPRTEQALKRVFAKHIAANLDDPKALSILRRTRKYIPSEKLLRRAYYLQAEKRWRASIVPLLRALTLRWDLAGNPYYIKCLLNALLSLNGRQGVLRTASHAEKCSSDAKHDAHTSAR